MVQKVGRSPNFSYAYEGDLSPRVNGKLRLRANTLRQLQTVTRTFLHERAIAAVKADAFQGQTGTYFFNELAPPASLYNEVREAFLREAYKDAKAAIGVDLAEIKSTSKMLLSTARKLATGASQIRRGRFARAARTFGLRSVPKRARRAKPFEENWLAYHFGWVPLLGSIHDGAKALATPIQSTPWIRKSRTTLAPEDRRYDGTYQHTTTVGCVVRLTIAGGVRVTNAVLAASNQWGVINPAQVAWALVPFSFVVDWFTNVSDWIGSPTDLLGVTIDNLSTTTFKSAVIKTQILDSFEGPYKWYWWQYTYNTSKTRTVGTLPPVQLTFSVASLGLWHLITTSALLSTFLRK